jgi:hypothetical protein
VRKSLTAGGMVLHTCNPSTWRLRQEDLKFEGSLDYTVMPPQKRKALYHSISAILLKVGVYIMKAETQETENFVAF